MFTCYHWKRNIFPLDLVKLIQPKRKKMANTKIQVHFERATLNEAATIRLVSPGVDLALTIPQAKTLAQAILMKVSKWEKTKV